MILILKLQIILVSRSAIIYFFNHFSISVYLGSFQFYHDFN